MLNSLKTYPYENVLFNVTPSNCKNTFKKCKYQYILCYNCKHGHNPICVIKF